jgi:hypothetical protein
MKVEFDNTHLIAYGEEFEGNKNSYAYYFDPSKHPMSQVQICLTGEPQFILDKLKKIVVEMEFEGKINKPTQGVIIHNNGYVSEVITPVWKGKIDSDVQIPDNPAECIEAI